MSTRPKPQVVNAPSWSWAAKDGHVIFEPPLTIMDDDNYEYVFDVLNCDTHRLNDIGIFASSVAGEVIISAPTVDGLWTPPTKSTEEDHGSIVVLDRAATEAALLLSDITADYHEAIPKDEVQVRLVVLVRWALDLGTEARQSLGLVLVATDADHYRRLGSFAGPEGCRLAEIASHRETTII